MCRRFQHPFGESGRHPAVLSTGYEQYGDAHLTDGCLDITVIRIEPHAYGRDEDDQVRDWKRRNAKKQAEVMLDRFAE